MDRPIIVRTFRPLALAALLALACAAGLGAQDAPLPSGGDPGQAADSAEVRPDSAVVVFRGDTLGILYGYQGPFSPSQRAAALIDGLRGLRATGFDPDSVAVAVDGATYEVTAGSLVLVTITAEDAAAHGTPADEVAAAHAASTSLALSGSLFSGSLRDWALGILGTILATLGLWLLLRVLRKGYVRLYRRIRAIQEQNLPSLRFQGLVLLSGERIERGLLLTAKGSRLVLSGLLLFAYFPLVFSFFPATRVFAQALFRWVSEPLIAAGVAFVAYLPSLFTIVVLIVLTYYGLKLMRMVFSAVGAGAVRIPGFYSDWANPTYKLLRVLVVAFALVLVWPHLPSSGTLAFQGVAAFLGLLITFGSAGAVSNVVGGVVMIYMRPFQIGDRVKIADTIGDVIERGMLVTRLRTIKNVEITIPNSMVLGSHIINYSATAMESGVILHTTATIGYDAPWRTVHEVMTEAARRTEGILEDPAPFVLQTALGDSAVSYELNVYTREPGHMAAIYSGLHRNLQDTFAEAGIEIMSPIYHAYRDGNPSTLPSASAPRVGHDPEPHLHTVPRGDG